MDKQLTYMGSMSGEDDRFLRHCLKQKGGPTRTAALFYSIWKKQF
jgi:hypothetical protein